MANPARPGAERDHTARNKPVRVKTEGRPRSRNQRSAAWGALTGAATPPYRQRLAAQADRMQLIIGTEVGIPSRLGFIVMRGPKNSPDRTLANGYTSGMPKIPARPRLRTIAKKPAAVGPFFCS